VSIVGWVSAKRVTQQTPRHVTSVYFLDRVVPTLPEAISNDLCSLKEWEERACLAVCLVFDKHGNKRGTPSCAMMRTAAKLGYEEAQAAIVSTHDLQRRDCPLLLQERMGAVGVLLYYLAAGNLALSLTAGTCTQGDADRLWGGLLSLLLFAAALVFILRATHPIPAAMALLPLLPLLGWATLFTVRFLAGYWWWNATACDVLEGTHGHFADGREHIFALLWAVLTIVAWSGIVIISLRCLRERMVTLE